MEELELSAQEAEEVFSDGWENEKIDDEPVEEAEEAAEGEEEEVCEPLDEEKGAQDFTGFILEHPDLAPDDIPDEVWRRVAAGESLSEAWTKHENGLLKERLFALELREKNALRSAGSRRSSGAAKPYDPFEDGWESA